jgi:hypothetical protein
MSNNKQTNNKPAIKQRNRQYLALIIGTVLWSILAIILFLGAWAWSLPQSVDAVLYAMWEPTTTMIAFAWGYSIFMQLFPSYCFYMASITRGKESRVWVKIYITFTSIDIITNIVAVFLDHILPRVAVEGFELFALRTLAYILMLVPAVLVAFNEELFMDIVTMIGQNIHRIYSFRGKRPPAYLKVINEGSAKAGLAQYFR